jgi:hypothetical protein
LALEWQSRIAATATNPAETTIPALLICRLPAGISVLGHWSNFAYAIKEANIANYTRINESLVAATNQVFADRGFVSIRQKLTGRI